MSENPKISVLMPAYNAEKYIGEAIESILNQTFKDFEFIVIDDCSTDKTWEIIQKYAANDLRIRFFKNEKNLKLSLTLNKGIDLCRSQYVARMDADDFSYPDRLEKQYNFMENNPEVGISGGSMNVCDQFLNVRSVRNYNLTDEEIRKHIFRYSPFCHPLVIIRKAVFDKVGKYDTNFNPAEDYELYFRIGVLYKFGNLKDTLLKYRTVEKSMTTGSTKKMELETIRIRNQYANGYHMSLADKVYTMFQYFSIFIIPAWVKIRIFSFLRDK